MGKKRQDGVLLSSPRLNKTSYQNACTPRKKGQYRILFEVMLILIGILITGYVISNFGDLQATVTTLAVSDNFNSIANEVMIGLLKASANNGTIVRIPIPDKISGQVYSVAVDGPSNSIRIASLTKPSLFVTREIFNIGQVNRIISSQVVSSARVLEVVSENGYVRVRRGV